MKLRGIFLGMLILSIGLYEHPPWAADVAIGIGHNVVEPGNTSASGFWQPMSGHDGRQPNWQGTAMLLRTVQRATI